MRRLACGCWLLPHIVVRTRIYAGTDYRFQATEWARTLLRKAQIETILGKGKERKGKENKINETKSGDEHHAGMTIIYWRKLSTTLGCQSILNLYYRLRYVFINSRQPVYCGLGSGAEIYGCIMVCDVYKASMPEPLWCVAYTRQACRAVWCVAYTRQACHAVWCVTYVYRLCKHHIVRIRSMSEVTKKKPKHPFLKKRSGLTMISWIVQVCICMCMRVRVCRLFPPK